MKRAIELIGSLRDNGNMGRPKNFSREGVLEKTIPVLWKHGFADTSLQDLERAAGAIKSGLYAKFKGKEDLILASSRHYFGPAVGKKFSGASMMTLAASCGFSQISISEYCLRTARYSGM
jgi:hypothetical protein